MKGHYRHRAAGGLPVRTMVGWGWAVCAVRLGNLTEMRLMGMLNVFYESSSGSM